MGAGVAVSAIVLAAGFSRRAAPHHKLLLPAPDGSGRVVLRATVEAALGVGLAEVLVVTGHERGRVEAALAGLAVRLVHAPDFAAGMGRSLAAGVAAVDPAAAGFAVVPGDLPRLRSEHIRAVVDEFERLGSNRHVIPVFRGERGHPVVLGAWLRGSLLGLAGDVGARPLLDAPEEGARSRFLVVEDDAFVRDFDRGTPG